MKYLLTMSFLVISQNAFCSDHTSSAQPSQVTRYPFVVVWGEEPQQPDITTVDISSLFEPAQQQPSAANQVITGTAVGEKDRPAPVTVVWGEGVWTETEILHVNPEVHAAVAAMWQEPK